METENNEFLKNNSQSEDSNEEIAFMDTQNLKMQNDSQLQINFENNISTDGSDVSFEANSSSSGIEMDLKEIEEGRSDEESNINKKEEADNCSSYEVEENSITNNGKEQKNTDNGKNIENNAIPLQNELPSVDSIKIPYKDPKNAFEVVVPLIGNNVINVGDIKPFAHRYDLAKEFNRLKALAEAPYLTKLSYQEWRKQQEAKTQGEKGREEKEHIDTSLEISAFIMKTSIGILEEMKKDNPNELFIERFLLRFLRIPASTLTLVLVMPFIHIIMYIRSYPDFSMKLRKVANECFWKCHVMFPIPDGYNFQTVYTSEVIKNVPDVFNLMDNYVLDYDDVDESSASESEDLGFAEGDEIE
ncbi:uncharacterized protein CDAR_163841 [Caerostris darwini]|uniref:Uncharacterized protein n=1 Tax=Caerostris darwini TaxID=1538125 RepID=A0AAV4UWB7_9ARAC|nr:uncharacterized protein CDAR_163841 [Caerostris darwini]